MASSSSSIAESSQANELKRKRKEAHAAQVAARAAERAAKLAAMTEAERAEFDAAEQRRSDEIYAAKVEQWRKLDEAYASGQRVVIDLSYGDRMSEKERKSLARQLTPCWGANRIARAPVQMHFTGLGSCPIECLPKGGVEMGAWKVHRHDGGITDIFSSEELVFLSPDAEEVLQAPLDPKSVYVIGGFVDATIQRCVSLDKAEAIGARAVRLPLVEHAPMGINNPRLPLTVNAVFQILLSLHAGDPWDVALGDAIAIRHQVPGNLSRKEKKEHKKRAKAKLRASSSEDEDEDGGHPSSELPLATENSESSSSGDAQKLLKRARMRGKRRRDAGSSGGETSDSDVESVGAHAVETAGGAEAAADAR